MTGVKEACMKHVSRYAHAEWFLAFKELGITVFLFFGTLASYDWFVQFGWYGSLQWLMLRALVFVRMFIITHDCMHNSFFPKTKWNTWVGRVVGAYVLTPFEKWRRGHLFHHNTSGNLEVVNIEKAIYSGDTIFITKKDWDAMTPKQRVLFKAIRHPLVFFTIMPFLVFGVLYRIGSPKRRSGVMFVNVYRVCDLIFWNCLIGNGYWYIEVLAMWIGASIGFMLFHLQHGVNDGYRVSSEEFDRIDASLKGSTYLQVPGWLRWVTLNIEYHHIHHIDPRVPCYKLALCHDEAPIGMWGYVNHVDLQTAWESLGNVMWDEATQKYTSF